MRQLSDVDNSTFIPNSMEAPIPTTPQLTTLTLDDATTTVQSPRQPSGPARSPAPSRLSLSPQPSHASPSLSPEGDALTADGMFWLNPLEGIDPGKHSDEEEPLRRHIKNVPSPDDDHALPISEAQAWLDTPTVSTPFYFILIYLF